jgi:hypothetical protein
MTTAPAGVLTVQPRALAQVVRGVVRDLVGAPAAETSVRLEAVGAGLAVHVVTRVPLAGAGALLGRLHQVRSDLARRVGEITERRVDRVDLRVAGVLPAPRGRVR